jgi:serine phosphatase RsbU (regulator of sigma subunit)
MNLYFENFIIYRPKDVVSGDFYWFSHIPIKNNKPAKEIIAIVDCTGHGVPGAFMSMIGSRMLSEIVNERGITNPSKILIELNKMLNFVLHQDSTENFDGMDVALCTIEKVSNNKYSICFAGANRPISYYKKENLKIENIKGNRKYIGGFLPDIDENFQEHSFVLETGDCLFLYTDGLTDQNNEFNKKFTTGRFETILVSNIEKPMIKIEKNLEDAFDSFKGDVLQRDDVTVVGIRLK